MSIYGVWDFESTKLLYILKSYYIYSEHANRIGLNFGVHSIIFSHFANNHDMSADGL
jgi:hypothetical protein